MIIGIGTDLVRITRLEVVMAHQNTWGLVCDEKEQKYCREGDRPVLRFAMLWAIKEAYKKAANDRDRDGNTIHVSFDTSGTPMIELDHDHHHLGKHIAVSHDGDYATATVILERAE